MSKWSLLRAALAPSSNVQNGAVSSSLSIHRFEGHQRIAKKKSLWSGFRLHVHTSSFPRTASILNHCLMYFQNIDTTEFFLHVESQNEEELRGLIDDILATTSGIEVAHPHSTEAISDIHHLHVDLNQAPSLKTSTSASESSWEAVLRVRHGSLVPVHQCLHFHQYALTCQQGQSKVIWTREPPKQKKINIKELLSDRLYGVDNTGNVCVWPSEPLLLHLLLTEPPLRSLIEGKKVLEIGGGMAGLIGLGLTSYQLCAELCITDGHPHCVLNQVLL